MRLLEADGRTCTGIGYAQLEPSIELYISSTPRSRAMCSEELAWHNGVSVPAALKQVTRVSELNQSSQFCRSHE